MSIRITTLSENTAGRGNLLAEWGLSILLETEKTSVLLDTGSSISAVHNVDTLGIDLNKIDRIVLSHGHYDHTGGLRQLLQKMRRKVEVVAHPDIWQAKYARRKDEPDRYIGIPFQRNELESLGAVFNLSAKPVSIDDSITTTGEIPMVNSFEQVDADLFVKEDAGWQQDNIMDDQALIVNTGSGLVVVLGCAHRGISESAILGIPTSCSAAQTCIRWGYLRRLVLVSPLSRYRQMPLAKLSMVKADILYGVIHQLRRKHSGSSPRWSPE